MCQMVGVDWKEIDFQKHNWFYEHAWTEEQEAEFVEWLADFLHSNKEARLLFEMWRGDKKTCRRYAEGFVWNYGWKVNYFPAGEAN